MSLTILLSALPFFANVQANELADHLAKPGFLLGNNPNLPANIRKGVQSVLKIQTPILVFDLSDSKQVEKMKIFISDIDRIIPDVFERARLRSQFEDCRLAKNYCVIWNSGSAVVLNDGSILTALHNINYSVQKMAKKNAIWSDAFQLRLPIRLRDSEGNILTGAGDLSPTNAKIIKIAKALNNKPIGSSFPGAFDFVILELKKPLSLPGVRINLQSLAYDGLVYLAGFPIRTFDRVTLGATDSNGKSQLVSYGLKEPQSSMFEIGFEGDCPSGFSGGGLFDSEGQLLGILTRNNLKDINQKFDPKNRCRGISVDVILFNSFDSLQKVTINY